jgi:hypothetical protein
MDVRELVKEINIRAKAKGLGIGQSCIGIGPYNWIFRHHFPHAPGLYWFYVDQPIELSTGTVLTAKEVVYIGMTNGRIADRLGQHMRISLAGEPDSGHPWAAGEGWEFANGTLFTNHEKHRHRTQESADLIRTGQLWVGWFCLNADDSKALYSLESDMIAQTKAKDGKKPFFNIND